MARHGADRIDARSILRKAKKHLPPGMVVAGKLAGHGAVETSASGCWVTLSDGRSVLDFGSYAVALLGHRHPEVVAAVREQLGEMPTATRTLVNPVTVEAAAQLSAWFDGRLPRVYIGSDGADAVEAAIKLARVATGRATIAAATGAFHGKTLGALALTHHPRFRAGLPGELLRGAVHLDPTDPLAVERLCARTPIAAVIIEPVQGENGVQLLDTGVLRAWADSAHAHGAFVIADEIQCGLGRCGERSVALADGIPIDALLVGKALGGAVVPVSAALCSEELYRPLIDDPTLHTSTFSGHPLHAAAIPAALEAIDRHRDDGRRIARRMAEGLSELARRFPDHIAGHRGRGLLWGIDFHGPEITGAVQIGLARMGLVVSTCLGRPETLRLLPPIVTTDEDLDIALSIVGRAVDDADAAA